VDLFKKAHDRFMRLENEFVSGTKTSEEVKKLTRTILKKDFGLH